MWRAVMERADECFDFALLTLRHLRSAVVQELMDCKAQGRWKRRQLAIKEPERLVKRALIHWTLAGELNLLNTMSTDDGD